MSKIYLQISFCKYISNGSGGKKYSYCRIRSKKFKSPCMAIIPREALLHRQRRHINYKIKIINGRRTVGTDNPNKHNEYSQTENRRY